MSDSDSHPDVRVDEWLAEQHRRMVTDLDSTLDIEAGLREAMIPARHADIVADLGDVLDVEAGLGAIVPTAPAPTSHEPRALAGTAAVRGPRTRFALLVGCSEYEDPTFPKLPADQDIEALKPVLEKSEIGDFTIDPDSPLNETSWVVQERIEAFFANHQADDLLLLYFSCHGVLDARGRLYFVASNTRRESPESTGISARWVRKQMDHSRSRRVVLLLDCCYSGAFTTDVQRSGPARAGRILKQLGGRGRVVITASDETEEIPSGFTNAIVRGLGTGAADLDGDGQIEVSELYRYVRDQVRQKTSDQTPTMSVDGIRGQLYLARNQHALLDLPPKLAQLVVSPAVWERLWALAGLQHLLAASDHLGGKKLTARNTLLRLRDQDTDETVRAAAEKVLTTLSPPPEPPRRHRLSRRAVVVTVVLGVLLSLTSVLAVQKVTTSHAIPCVPSTKSANGVLSLGTLIPTTGAQTFRSPALETSVQLAIQDITAAGGIPGVALRFDRTNQRDEGDPLLDDIVSQSTSTLLGSDVDAIIGPVASVAAEKVIDKVTCAGVIMFSPANTAPRFSTYPDRGLYFRTAPTTLMEGSVLGKLVVDDGNSTVVVMSRDDAYGNSLREETGRVIERSGGRVLDSFPLNPRAPDYEKEIRRVKDKDPDAIVVIGFAESSRTLPDMIKEGVGPRNKKIYGANSNMNNTLIGRVSPQNPGALEGMRGTLLYPTDERFVNRLKMANSSILDLAYAAHAYDAVVVTALAAALAGTDEPAAVAREINGVTKDGEKCSDFVTCKKLVEDGKNVDYDGPSGPLEFTDPGEPNSATYWISEIQADGTVKLLRSEKVGP